MVKCLQSCMFFNPSVTGKVFLQKFSGVLTLTRDTKYMDQVYGDCLTLH